MWLKLLESLSGAESWWLGLLCLGFLIFGFGFSAPVVEIDPNSIRMVYDRSGFILHSHRDCGLQINDHDGAQPAHPWLCKHPRQGSLEIWKSSGHKVHVVWPVVKYIWWPYEGEKGKVELLNHFRNGFHRTNTRKKNNIGCSSLFVLDL